MSTLPNELLFRFIAELLQLIQSTNQHEKVFSLVVDRLIRMYHCQSCALVLIDPKTEYLTIENSHGLSHTFCKAFRRNIATAAIGRLLWTGKPIVISDAAQQSALAEEIHLEHPFASCTCVQISVDERPEVPGTGVRREREGPEPEVTLMKTIFSRSSNDWPSRPDC